LECRDFSQQARAFHLLYEHVEKQLFPKPCNVPRETKLWARGGTSLGHGYTCLLGSKTLEHHCFHHDFPICETTRLQKTKNNRTKGFFLLKIKITSNLDPLPPSL
jgi:hypothetical protein